MDRLNNWISDQSVDRVRALREEARRWILRQKSTSYGMQQARNVLNARKCEDGIRSASFWKLLLSLNSLKNKRWVRQVPAAAVIPAPRVVTPFIGLKAFVAGLISSQ